MPDLKIDIQGLTFVKTLIAVATPVIILAIAWTNVGAKIRANETAIQANEVAIKEIEGKITKVDNKLNTLVTDNAVIIDRLDLIMTHFKIVGKEDE
jgi:hypothetical protein